jgi:hypothetical protein
MSTWALALATGLYLVTAIDLYIKQQHGLALAFLAYAVANVGLILAAQK